MWVPPNVENERIFSSALNTSEIEIESRTIQIFQAMNFHFTQLELMSDETYYSVRVNSMKVRLKIMHDFVYSVIAIRK